MDFTLTADETKDTSAITSAAYDAWVLVNDYFSWEKEYKNYESAGSKGVIANSVFLFMKWHAIDAKEAKAMLKKEIIAREAMYIKAKEDFNSSGIATERTHQWMVLLDLITAGNFVWSMTTARYRIGAEDSYPKLRRDWPKTSDSSTNDSLGSSISENTEAIANRIDPILEDRKYLDLNYVEPQPFECNDGQNGNHLNQNDQRENQNEKSKDKRSQVTQVGQLHQHEKASQIMIRKN